MLPINRGEAPHTNKEVGKLGDVKYYNSSYTSFPRHELNPPDQDYARERFNAINHNTKEGVKPMTKEEQEFERSLNWKLIKKFTMAIFKMDVTRFSFPVGYNEPRTFLERSADLFGFLTQIYLDRAENCNDPSMRLANVAVGIAAGYHYYLQQKKPWNPVLGETYIGRWENDVTIYGEQTSHHPPVSQIQIVTPNNKWKINAKFNFAIDTGITRIDILQKGLTELEFGDGTHIEWEFPIIAVTGLLHGDRVVKVSGVVEIKDTTHNLIAVIDVNPTPSKTNGIKKSRPTTIYGGVAPIPSNVDKKEKKSLQFNPVIKGDYCDKLFIGDEKAWDINENIVKRPNKQVDDDEILPSDCRYRIDRGYLIEGNMDVADKAKTIMEECQRHDYKLRESIPKH
ncbi:Oxysterol binding protein [Histomonas meleagridis]|uniref:Oxysterol binding protein n=1 Tax=Histomonas meleagridis TaxID=135588 RepID=UPI0035595191|nr:Oxysterol binding protein [Histomonas meleagridis]KAH0803940.1 Oxysterol binding protein [Histomonas meleagridis]